MPRLQNTFLFNRTVSMALVLLSVMLFAGGAFAFTPGAAWYEAAKSRSNFEAAKKDILQWKVVGGYSDMAPLANKLVELARESSDPQSARSLTSLAIIAAPEDPMANYAHARAVLKADGTYGEAIRAGNAAVSSFLADPFVSFSIRGMAIMVLGITGFLLVFAVYASTGKEYLPLLAHDVCDLLPKKVGRFTPYAAAFALISLLVSLGGGLLLFLIIPSIALMGYLPIRTRTVLALGLALSVFFFNGYKYEASLAGQAGDRAFALYRAWKGDVGEDLGRELNERFSESNPKGLVARAMMARRNGDYPQAKALLLSAVEKSQNKGVASFQLGGIHFMEKDYEKAIKSYKDASEAMPQDWLILYNLNVAYLAHLDLNLAKEALNKARALNASEVESHQAQNAMLGGVLYASYKAFPSDWILGELEDGLNVDTAWADSIWGAWGSINSKITPTVMAVIVVLGFLISFPVSKGRLSRRCKSCGTIKCPRCHRIVKDETICGGCYALIHESGVDATSKRLKRDEINAFSVNKRKTGRKMSIALPGWYKFFQNGGIFDPFLGVLWALSLGVLVTHSVVSYPVSPWGNIGFPTVTLVVLVFTYAVSALVVLRK